MSYIQQKKQKETEMDILFGDYSHEEIKEMLEANIMQYYTLKKAEKIASRLVQSKGGFFKYLHNDFYQKFELLYKYAKSQGIQIDFSEKKDVQVDTEDVIEVIRENEADRMQSVYEYYHQFQNGNERKNSELRQKLDKDIQEINAFYDAIVEEYEEKMKTRHYYQR